MPAQPRRPTLGWDNFSDLPAPALPTVDALPHQLLATSGRAALFLAMRALGVRAGDVVLAPTYHCPTLVAPLREAGASVRFYPLDADGLPRLEDIVDTTGVRAIVVAQLFGLPRSLAPVRAWCDARGIALVEDCAHSFFGQAGERAVGAWGDLATASLSKFFPVWEGGLLASARPLPPMPLQPAGFTAQLRAVVDLLEQSSTHRRLGGLNTVLAAAFRLKNGPPRPSRNSAAAPPPRLEDEAQALRDCDLARCDAAAPALAGWLLHHLPRSRMVARRRANYALLHELCRDLPGMRPLFDLPDRAAPYALPLWVDEPEPVYARLRAAGCTVLRWDLVWPGVPEFEGDTGRAWQRHLLQLRCHQDLRPEQLRFTAEVLRSA